MGRWLRQVEVEPTPGATEVMQGADGAPLLLLERVEAGRVALLASDHAWLWNRGYEGGGPQLELLRRLAHWMMREPDLEEEALTATADGVTMSITRRSLGTGARDVVVTAPDGSETTLALREDAPGLYRADMAAPAMGLYRLTEGDQQAVVAVGPASPKEFEATIASGDVLAPVITPTGGGVVAVEEGAPVLRAVHEGRVAAGRGWIGYTPRNAYVVEALSVTSLAPAWAMLLITAGLAVIGWLVEGRRRRAA